MLTKKKKYHIDAEYSVGRLYATLINPLDVIRACVAGLGIADDEKVEKVINKVNECVNPRTQMQHILHFLQSIYDKSMFDEAVSHHMISMFTGLYVLYIKLNNDNLFTIEFYSTIQYVSIMAAALKELGYEED